VFRLNRVGRELEWLESRRAELWARAEPDVLEMRAAGASWRKLGRLLGVSDTALYKRFREADRAAGSPTPDGVAG